MGASLDFAVNGEPVEIKNVDYLRFRDGDWVAEGDEIFDAPLHYLIQLQHQMACLPEAAGGWLVVCIGGNQLKRMRVERHPGMIERIEEEVDDFWRSVDEGDEPEPDYTKDAATINKLFGGTEEVADLTSDEEAADLARQWSEAHATEVAAKKAKQAAIARLKIMGGDAKTVFLPDRWTLKASHVKGGVREVGPHWRFALNQAREK